MFCLVLMLSQVNILQYFFAKNYTKGFLFLVKSLIKQQIFSKLIGTRYPNSCKYAPVYIMGRIVGLLHLLLFSFCSLNIFMFVSKLLVIMSVLSWEYSAPLSAWYHQTPARNNICIYPLYTIVYSTYIQIDSLLQKWLWVVGQSCLEILCRHRSDGVLWCFIQNI